MRHGQLDTQEAAAKGGDGGLILGQRHRRLRCDALQPKLGASEELDAALVVEQSASMALVRIERRTCGLTKERTWPTRRAATSGLSSSGILQSLENMFVMGVNSQAATPTCRPGGFRNPPAPGKLLFGRGSGKAQPKQPALLTCSGLAPGAAHGQHHAPRARTLSICVPEVRMAIADSSRCAAPPPPPPAPPPAPTPPPPAPTTPPLPSHRGRDQVRLKSFPPQSSSGTDLHDRESVLRQLRTATASPPAPPWPLTAPPLLMVTGPLRAGVSLSFAR